MRKAYSILALAVLASCGPVVPDSNPQGAGFQDYNSYVRNGGGGVMGEPIASQPVTGFSPDVAAAAIAAAEGGAQTGYTGATVPAGALPAIDPACQGRGVTMAGIQETTSEMQFATGGVSDEQDFGAVSTRESIESDKQRIACNRQQYVVVQPGAIPQRPGDEGPNIAAYAVATNNAPGVKLYNRPAFYLTNPEKACAKFTSPDKAQQAFLAAGGPQRDSKALDPDGDGFACAWDPRPFRAAAR